MPIKTPKKIGDKNKKYFFGFLKKCSIEYNIFSYKPKITRRTPALRPGKIAATPINMPNKNLFKVSPIKYIRK